MKKILKLIWSLSVLLLLEFCWLAGIMMQNEKSVYINYAVTILSLIAVLSIINNPKMNPGYKLMWAVCILALPFCNRNLPVRHSRPFQCGKEDSVHYDTVLLFAGRRSWRGRRDA